MKRKVILFSLVAVTAIGFVGCASDNADRDSHKRTTGRYIDDKVLVRRVKSSLNDNEVYKFPDVKVIPYTEFYHLPGSDVPSHQRELARQIVAAARDKGCDAVISGNGA